MTTPFIGFNQHIVGDDVEFFLDFTLHVFDAGRTHDIAQFATQGAFVHRMADAFTSTRNNFQQQTQFRRNTAFGALLFDQITCERNSHRVSFASY